MSDGYTPFGGGTSGSEADDSGFAVAPSWLGGANTASDSGAGTGDVGGSPAGTGSGEFDPDIHVGRDRLNADGSFTRKRGRRTGHGNSSGRKANKASSNQAGIDALVRVLAITHIGLATVTKTPELVLQDDESKYLAESVANVLIEFDIRPDPKAEAIFGLCVAASMIYGPRAVVIRERWKKEAKQDAAESPE